MAPIVRRWTAAISKLNKFHLDDVDLFSVDSVSVIGGEPDVSPAPVPLTAYERDHVVKCDAEF